MGKKKATPLAQAINLVSQLSDDEQRTVADLIRLYLNPPVKRKAAKKVSPPSPKDAATDDKEAGQEQ